MTQIVLIGFMGAGKTSVGKQLAQKLNLPLLDTDHLIEEKLAMAIPDIFARHGEAYFRQQETQMLQSLYKQGNPGIISTGGGIILTEESRKVLEAFSTVVFLEVEMDQLVERIQRDTKNVRPLFLNHSAEAFQEIYFQRLPLYRQVGKIVIQSERKTIEEITNEIIARVGG